MDLATGMRSRIRTALHWLAWVATLIGIAAGARIISWFVSGGPAPTFTLWVAIFSGTATGFILLMIVIGAGFLHFGLRGSGLAPSIVSATGFVTLLLGIGLALLVPARMTLASIPSYGP